MTQNVAAGTEREPPDYMVQPVVRALTVLRHIAAGNRCRNSSRTARAIGINRTTLIRLLATLEAERMIEALPDDGGYRLSTGLISLASMALNERGIIQVARPVLKRLVDELRMSAHLGLREDREIVYLARETPVSHLVSTVREGTRLSAHATSMGRALLADLSPADLAELYRDAALEAYTDKTRTTLADLERQLQEDRARGLAWSVENFEAGIGSAAAAVRDHRGDAVAAINVTGPSSLFAGQTESTARIAAALSRAARDISEAMGYPGGAESPRGIT